MPSKRILNPINISLKVYALLNCFSKQKCQETVERAYRVDANIMNTELPQTYERVNRVLIFMASYPRKKTIQRVGMDALLFFARNGKTIPQIYMISYLSD